MEKCKYWEETKRIVRWYRDEPLRKIIQICNGTKEREECNCDGDVSKCNFYLDKRKGKTMTTLEMMNQAALDGKTYKSYSMRYNKFRGFHDENGNKWDSCRFTYVNDIFAIDTWQIKPDNEMTKSEAEAKFNIKIVGD